MENWKTLYLRPKAAIEPYRVNGAARWLLAHYPAQFQDERSARMYLFSLFNSDPQLYRSILARYFEASDFYLQRMPDWRNPNRYFSTNSSVYGEDPHLYWRAQAQ
jgi:hypothetical protein